MRIRFFNRPLIMSLFLCTVPMTVWAQASTFSPAPDAQNVAPDSPLRLTFVSPPVVGTGKIQVLDTANIIIDTIDVAQPTRTQTIGGLTNFKYFPILIAGNQAAVYLPNHTLTYNQTYTLKLDPGVFKDRTGNALETPASWRFTTKAPVKNAPRLTVAADGSGDFATVQGALDFIPEGNTNPVTIFIKKGTYNEIVFFHDKNAITLLGEDRKQTILAYANNEQFNPPVGNPFLDATKVPADFDPLKGEPIYHRGLFLAHRVNDLTITNLTLHNTTRQGGSQAETIILNGTTKAHALITNVDFLSFQDTIQINGQAYLENCYIEGDTDFMWGTGPVFMQNVACKSLRSAPFTQIRNPTTNKGFVYSHCTFEGTAGVTNSILGGIATAKYPASELVFLDCVMTNAVSPVGFNITGDASRGHYWEFNSHDADGKPIQTSRRLAGSKQLTQPADAETIKNYGNPKWVLGGDWDPTLITIPKP